MVDRLLEARGFLLDLDGTIYLGNQLTEGALAFIETLQRRNINYLFLTNNSSKHPCQYVEKLNYLGLSVHLDKIFSSSLATAWYLMDMYGCPPIGRLPRLFVIGTPNLEEVFHEAGFQLDAQHPEMVVLGFDTTLTYEKLWKLCSYIRAGLPYIATHADLNCPIQGDLMPDVGAMIAFVKAATGREPDLVVGKPNRIIAEMAAQKLGLPLTSLVMVGDRLYTDIAMGHTSGVFTVLVLSGETQPQDIAASPYQPDAVFAHLGELASYIGDKCLT